MVQTLVTPSPVTAIGLDQLGAFDVLLGKALSLLTGVVAFLHVHQVEFVVLFALFDLAVEALG